MSKGHIKGAKVPLLLFLNFVVDGGEGLTSCLGTLPPFPTYSTGEWLGYKVGLVVWMIKKKKNARAWDMTRRGLQGPVTESRWSEIFHTHLEQAWGPNSLLYNGYPRVGGQGMVLTMPWPPSAEVRERLELYLYSPFVH